MQLQETLQYLGLSDKEAKVYVALLQLGTGSVPAISVRAGTKRPTTYLILEELRKRGLATLLPRKNKALYSAQSPELLLEEQEEKEEMIRLNLPELMAIYNAKKEKPKVVYYQGEENIIKLYDEVYKEKEIMFYGSIGSIPRAIYKHIEKQLEIVRQGNHMVREILQAEEKSIEFSKIGSHDNHKIKIVDEKLQLPTDNIIFGNKVAIMTYKDEPMAVVIESSDVAATYRSMFEMVWNAIA